MASLTINPVAHCDHTQIAKFVDGSLDSIVQVHNTILSGYLTHMYGNSSMSVSFGPYVTEVVGDTVITEIFPY